MLQPKTRGELPQWRAGDAFLAGGSWLFSEPQPAVLRLIDLAALGWPALQRPASGGLEIAATCRLAELERFASVAASVAAPVAAPVADWPACHLFAACVHALWGSFKIRNTATVGGNLCLALPAAPIAALATALDARCVIWTAGGGERTLPGAAFITDAGRNALRPGEVLRAIHLPDAALRRRSAFRQASLTAFGRSAALVIGTLDASSGAMQLTITASVRAPLLLRFATLPGAGALSEALRPALTDAVLHDDPHGSPGWKRQMTLQIAEEVRRELSA